MQVSIDDHERRREKWQAVFVPVKLNNTHGLSRNISPRGVYLETATVDEMHVGGEARIELDVSGSEAGRFVQSFAGNGRIARIERLGQGSSQARWGVGVELGDALQTRMRVPQ